MPQVVYASDRLLALITAFIEVSRGAGPVQFVGDRPFVGVEELSGSSGGDTQGFGSHGTGNAEAGGQIVDDRYQPGGLNNVQSPTIIFLDGRMVLGGFGVCETSRCNTGPRVNPHGGVQARDFIGGAQECQFSGSVSDFHAGSKLHARQPVHQGDRKSTRLNSSHVAISYAVFC